MDGDTVNRAQDGVLGAETRLGSEIRIVRFVRLEANA